MVEKRISILVCSALVSGILGGCSPSSKTTLAGQKENQSDLIKIGVTQLVEHQALDLAREGFITALKDKGYEEGKKIKIDFENAQGDIPTTQTIAEKFVNDNVKLIAAITTPSAQAAFNATKRANKNIPIVITAVTDPIQAGIAKSLDKSGTNVTGTSNAISIEGQFQLIKRIIPNAKNIGIVYNTSENNSEIQVKQAIEAATNFEFNIVTSGITNTNEIPQALNSILGKIDVLYVPTDNMIASSIATITKQCYIKNIPVFGSESGHVKGGAVATEGIDYFKLGYETGSKAVEVLEGKNPGEIPITKTKEVTTFINKDAVKKLSIKVPEDISSKAEKITGGVD